MSHTPTPWTLGSNGDDCAKNHAICSGPYVIAKVYGTGYPVGKGAGPESIANAAHIVKCVNSHDALVEALRGVLHHDRATKGQYKLPKSLIAHIEAALAEVKG